MTEVLLLKYGEIALKGQNKSSFENVLIKTIAERLERHGDFKIRHAQSTIYAEPDKRSGRICDIESAAETASRIFGIASVCRCIVTEKDMEAIKEAARNYIVPQLEGKKSFKVESKRSDKKFALSSPEISAAVGDELYKIIGEKVAVDVKNPEVTVKVEIREQGAYLHAGQIKGAGGIPVGTSGKAMLLLSGGIDSPVAGYMMAKRGIAVSAIYFESPPYTSEQAREKVRTLADEISDYCGTVRLTVVSLTEIQEEISRKCSEEYFTLLLRRSMMRIASVYAKKYGCGALITGESLGQVASQTMPALAVTDDAAELIVLRPCIGLDKDEIVVLARKIGTFDTSILPYEDCCTVFTPKHPRTRPDLASVIAEENKYDYKTLEAKAIMN